MDQLDTKTQIIDTALELFWKTSYHTTNMNDLSREVGINKATVYQHFRSKEDIAVASVARGAERTVEFVFEGAFQEYDLPLERLRDIHRRIYETHRAIFGESATCRGCPLVNIGTELATESEAIRCAVVAAFRRFAPYYQRIVEDLAASGALKQDIGTDQLVADLQDNMNAALVVSKMEKRPEAILDAAERAVRYLTV